MKQPSVETKEPIFVSQVKMSIRENRKVKLVDVWLKKSAISKLKKDGQLTVTDGEIIVRLMTAEDKIVITDENSWR
jgi:hypothetical protein